jgi:hypothetical protein
MTEKTPRVGSAEKEIAPNAGTGAVPPEAPLDDDEKVSFDDLYWRADSDRIGAEAWCTACERRMHEALARGDQESAETYRTAWRGHRKRVAQYERLQTLLTRIGSNQDIKMILADMARREKLAAQRIASGEALPCD